MKTSCYYALIAAAASSTTLAFAPPTMQKSTMVQRFMFGGSGSGLVEEEDPEKRKAMEAGAKQMGMSVEEYQLGMKARENMAQKMDDFRTTIGTEVQVVRDANSPPKHVEVIISDEAKSKGKDFVQNAIVTALKEANEESKKGREQAQKDMMAFIGDEMKKIGG